MQNATGHARFPEQLSRAFEGVALANRTEVEHHAFSREADRKIRFVQTHPAHSDSLPCLGQFGWVGQPACAAHETPAAHQRRHGDVERAFGFPAQSLRVLQQAKERRLHPHGLESGAGVDMADFTRRLIKVELSFEPLDFIERFLGRGAQAHFVLAVENDFKTRRHRVAGHSYAGHARNQNECKQSRQAQLLRRP